MNQSELKHEWTVDPSVGWLRLWCFVYKNVAPSQLTFCKLFWGFVFMPLMVVTWLPAQYLWRLATVVWEWLGLAAESRSLKTREKRLERIRRREEEPPAPPKAPREPVLLPKVEAFASKVTMKAAALSRIAGYIGLALGACAIAAAAVGLVWVMIHFWPYTGFVLGGIAGAALLVLAVLVASALIMDYIEEFVFGLLVLGVLALIGGAIWAGVTWWAVVQSILIVGVAAVVLLAFIIAAAWATIKFGGEPAMDYILRPAHEHVVRPVARGTGQAGVGFATVMKIGYRSVKTNTCPRIRISGDET